MEVPTLYCYVAEHHGRCIETHFLINVDTKTIKSARWKQIHIVVGNMNGKFGKPFCRVLMKFIRRSPRSYVHILQILFFFEHNVQSTGMLKKPCHGPYLVHLGMRYIDFPPPACCWGFLTGAIVFSRFCCACTLFFCANIHYNFVVPRRKCEQELSEKCAEQPWEKQIHAPMIPPRPNNVWLFPSLKLCFWVYFPPHPSFVLLMQRGFRSRTVYHVREGGNWIQLGSI